MLEKTFDPKALEPELYAKWEASGAFSPDWALRRNPAAPGFSMVIPPPNVTGSLHIGHALNQTLQDVLARYRRMRGDAVLWLPGTDHAGIATQMVVERQLAQSGNMGRRDLGREAFVEKVWAWKAESGGAITRQMRRLGASCDWSRERFTLDDGLSAAVRKVFVTLYNQGLIYRDKRLVNWDPQFQTAISDLEVENREVDGFYWHFAYPLADGSGEVVVATTRPETLLGDTAVAVHPDDPRYTQMIGKLLNHPITGRQIPVIADDYADPEKGSGAVKITPAHDFNDFQVGKRHDLPLITVLDADARILTDQPKPFAGQDRFAARKLIVEEMERLGLLRAIEPTRHVLPHGDRSGVVIEPFLTDQWYVDAKTLAGPAIAAVESGKTRFEPANWSKTYFEWMRNIEPWCVSRQLWWGHRIPAWYGPDGKPFIAETEAEALALAQSHYGAATPLRRDEDVLDTWFSSALWPFSTLGWPEDTAYLQRFYPTTTLVTSFDIIFFWVARMMMMGLHFKGEVPFETVFINALVRDEKGQKMSKSKGNVVDPLDLVDAYGADALRFTLTAMSGQARDLKLSTQRVEGYRNFCTKLWNAARFCEMNECVAPPQFDPATVREILNRWIRGETARTAELVGEALDRLAFDEAAQALYRFIWNVFCDWYLELAKPILNGEDEVAKAETRAMAAWTLDQALVLLHPVAPFITEALWEKTAEFGPKRADLLMTTPWPRFGAEFADPDAVDEINWLIGLVTEIRSIRSEMNVPASARAPLVLIGADATTQARVARQRDRIATLARLETIRFADEAPTGAVQFVAGEATGALFVADFIDLAAEKARLVKAIDGLEAERTKILKKLDNAEFLKKAPAAVVAENQDKLAEATEARDKMAAALTRLGTLS